MIDQADEIRNRSHKEVHKRRPTPASADHRTFTSNKVRLRILDALDA